MDAVHEEREGQEPAERGETGPGADDPRRPAFGPHIRKLREARQAAGEPLSLRRFAFELEIEPAYLSKIERSIFAPPSEELIVKIALRLGENPDTLLAMGGKIASDLKAIILRHPEELGALLRHLATQPEARIPEALALVRDPKG